MKKVNQYFFNLLLFLFIFLLPTQFGKHFFLSFSYISGIRIDYLSYAFYTTDILAVLLIFIKRQKIISFFKKKNVLTILLILALSVFFSFSPAIAFYKYLKILEIISIFVVFKNSQINKKLLLYSLLSGAILQLSLSFYQIINHRSVQGFLYFLGERYFTSSVPGIAKASLNGVEFLRPYGTFSHPNSLAGFYLLIYSLVLGIDMKNNPLLKNFFLIVCTMLILISFSKAAIFGLILINLIALKKTYNKAFCKFCSVSRTMVLILISMVFFYSKTDPLSIFKRAELVKNSLHIISTYPITGAGLGNYLLVQDKIFTNSLIFPPQPVHNIFLLLISEVGIFLSGAIIFLLLKYFYKYRKYNSLIYCAIVILITGSFDHYWFTLQQNMLCLVFVLSLITNSQVLFERSR
ncbi:MAG: hypothetical protein ABH812_01870 [bacterium]